MKVSRKCMTCSALTVIIVCWAPAAVLYMVKVNAVKVGESSSLPATVFPAISIILQRSPVDVTDQVRRLVAIDSGWAGWGQRPGYQSSQALNVQIYASVGSLSRSDPQLSLMRHITPIAVRDTNPLTRLTDALLAVIPQAPQWVVLANDHSFFVIPNLSCLLSNLNHDDMIYTGNHLAIQMTDGVLIFTSGGGGSVLSAPAVKAILLAWAVVDRTRLADAVEVAILSYSGFNSISKARLPYKKVWEAYLQKCAPALTYHIVGERSVFFDNIANINDLSFPRDCVNGFFLLFTLKLLMARLDASPPVSSVQLSLTAQMALHIRLVSKGSYQALFTNRNARYTSKSRGFFEIDDKIMRKQCIDNSKWGLENPGISVAKCLQRVFDVEIPETSIPSYSTRNQSEHLWRERFQVYGPVRTAVHDTDDWYDKMKVLVAAQHFKERKAAALDNDTGGVSTVSFHYVADVESSLLYRICLLMAQKPTSLIPTAELELLLTTNTSVQAKLFGAVQRFQNTLSHDSSNEAATNEQIHKDNIKVLLKHWPTTGIGGYGRKLKGLQEAEMLYTYLFRNFVVLRTDIDGRCIAPKPPV